MTQPINVDTIMVDIKDTVAAYEDVTGIVLTAEPDMEGHVDTVGMFLTFDTVEESSLYGEFSVFDLNLDGLQAIYDQMVITFPMLDVNLLLQ